MRKTWRKTVNIEKYQGKLGAVEEILGRCVENLRKTWGKIRKYGKTNGFS